MIKEGSEMGEERRGEDEMRRGRNVVIVVVAVVCVCVEEGLS